MGYDVSRTGEEEIEEDFICVVCHGILQNPVQSTVCQHIYCQNCIFDWMLRTMTCPMDRAGIEVHDLVPVPRLLQNLLNRFHLSCEYDDWGCNQERSMENIDNHQLGCMYKPDRVIYCEKGCGLSILYKTSHNHNCLNAVNKMISKLKRKKKALEEEVSNHEEFNKEDFDLFNKRFTMNQSLSNNQWFQSLQATNANKIKWKILISNSDWLLKRVHLKRLLDVGCPQVLAREISENSEESKWPEGLRTLDQRLKNTKSLQNYFLRSVYRNKLLIALEEENKHMGPLIIKPAILFFFEAYSN